MKSSKIISKGNEGVYIGNESKTLNQDFKWKVGLMYINRNMRFMLQEGSN